MPGWLTYVLVGLGGFFGSVARFLLARYIGGLIGTRWPIGTFVVNITGSCLLGLVGGVIAARVSPTSEVVRLAIGVGFIGAYTTFSTLEYETHELLETGEFTAALANVVGSVVAGMIAVRGGVLLARQWIA